MERDGEGSRWITRQVEGISPVILRRKIGDYNRDGRSDIMWQNDSGEAVIWGMNGTTVVGTSVLANPGPSWHI